MQPDVSVVIAAHNAEATLAGAIHSALAQRGATVEVIVVDDASTDGTATIARAFPEPAVRFVGLDENRGPGGARNAGFEQARGRWVAVLDADDTMEPDRLARVIARAERDGDGIAVDNLFVAGPTRTDRQTMFPPSHLETLGRLTLADFIRGNCLFRSTYNLGYMKPVFERAFVEAHGLRYDERLRIGEDYLFLAEALAVGGRCAVEPRAGYVYNADPRRGSVSRVLEMWHVDAMRAADAHFERSHDLDAEARQALRERRRSLDEAAAFLSVVEHLKGRAILKAARTALSDPVAMRHLRMPIAVRLRRLAALG